MSGECLSTLENIQSVIDGRIAHLNGLREMPSSELTLMEMRSVERRLYLMFGRQLATKHGMDSGSCKAEMSRYPNFRQWLHVVDVRHQEVLLEKLQNLSHLMKMGESEVRTVMKLSGCEEKEITRLLDALKSLKKVFRANYPSKDRAVEAEAVSPSEEDVTSPSDPSDSPALKVQERARSSSLREMTTPDQKRPSIDSLNSEPPADTTTTGITTASSSHSVPSTPPARDMRTPPHTPTSRRGRGKGTPPPNKKLNNLSLSTQPNIWSSADPLIRPVYGESATLGKNQIRSRDPRDRRYSDDHSSTLSSPSRSLGSAGTLTDMDYKSNKLPIAPKSPRAQQRSNMIHSIKHRFIKKPVMKNCDYCREKIVLHGFKCKDCKYVCHSSCKYHAEKVPSCGLPGMFEEVFKEAIEGGLSSSPLMPHKPVSHSEILPPTVASSTGDSSSNPSSTTSSTPSSPAPFNTPSSSSTTPPSPAQPTPSPRVIVSAPQFKFPPDVTDDFLDNNENVRSTSSEHTITLDTHDPYDPFTDSERTLPDQSESVDEALDPEPIVATRKNSQKHLSEWDIPYEHLEIQDLIGTGRFGAVHKGKWHGDVAIKMMDIDVDDEKQLQAFKREVSIFKKTRHDFVVLFMGACMRPPRLAIVTSLCKGMTLYTHIHLRKDRFNINRTIQIATQIAQGMGYLHHKGIVHKDLKSKNIFIENGKVVITDFALFSIGRLSKQKTVKDSLLIPDGWLCYLAPELITSLRINTDGNQDMELPFTEKSDVYAFGTIWYELLAGEWPFHKQPVETVIWQVGKGLKQPLCHLQASRDVKEILMMCWSYSPDTRPMFQQIKKTILRLPKKKGLHRSPSHPLHLSRSAESVL